MREQARLPAVRVRPADQGRPQGSGLRPDMQFLLRNLRPQGRRMSEVRDVPGKRGGVLAMDEQDREDHRRGLGSVVSGDVFFGGRRDRL